MNTRVLSWALEFSPQSVFAAVPGPEVQQSFRQQFSRWGLPLRVRVDNGHPWGNWNDLPTVLALWLIGLGVDLLWNDAGHPEQNPKVERSQGTGKRWAEPQRCQDAAELQTHFDDADRIQREVYPAVGGQSRWAAFPGLQQVRRPYTRNWERQHWSLERVATHLAGYTAVRQIASSGHTSVYDSRYYLGTAYAGQRVYVVFDPVEYEWVFTDEKGTQLRRFVARQITRSQIMNLRMERRS
jgi:hypothetical protein